MLYLSGVHALNIECALNTSGDWHRSAIRWNVISDRLKESSHSVFKEYGIEQNIKLSFLSDKPIYNVANHIRACLDLIEEGNFSVAQGMCDDFMCTDEYNDIVFYKVLLLRKRPNWKNIDEFMGKEYAMKWCDFKKKEGLF